MAGRPQRPCAVDSYCESDGSNLSSPPPSPTSPPPYPAAPPSPPSAAIPSSPPSPEIPPSPPCPDTIIDKRSWNGFVEVESEPSFFNVMLKNFGVRDVKVQEVISLDEETLEYLPRPVYGLIFLFKYREDDTGKQEQNCPEGVWFANQTINNACASIALLNIVNNIEGIELGENLRAFKEFTRDMTPALRGDAIANFKFVMDIHNSFAREVDILSADLEMKEHVASKKGKRKSASSEDEADSCFHFIAFVPIDGKVWKLDGLERQPQNLGDVQNEDWVSQVKPELEARMAQYEEGQTEFSILGLVKAPLDGLVLALARNVKSVVAVSSRLDPIKPDWKDCVRTGKVADWAKGVITGPNPAYELTQALIDSAEPSEELRAVIPKERAGDGAITSREIAENAQGTDAADALMRFLQELVDKQIALKNSIVDEKFAIELDHSRADSRRHDWTPALQCFIKKLSQKGLLQRLLGEEEPSRDTGPEAN